MRTRIAAIVGVVVFGVLAGTGVSYGLWSSNAQATGTVTTASLATTCAAPTKLVNGGFESPNIGTDPYRQIGSPFIPGWSVVNDNVIEIWRSQLPSTPPENAQIIELNGNGPGTAYQVVSTTPGQVLHWSLKHRGRDGTDTMAVAINANGAPLVQRDQFSTGAATWSYHEGVYVVPAGQTSTRISLIPISTFNNQPSIGNLVDDVTFGSGPCLSVSAAIANITTGGTTYRVGDVVEYTTTVTNGGGSHSASSVFSAAIPSGLTYVPGTITVDGVARTDATGDDAADISGGTVTARLGQGATSSAGGAISPANVITIRFRATVTAAAAGGGVSYNSQAAYVDALATGWAQTATSATLVTPIAAASDIAVAVQTLPQLINGSASQPRSWVFRVTNNGPSAATGVSVVVTVPGTLTARTVTVTGGGTCTAVASNASTCTIGNLAVGATQDITFTGTMPAAPSGAYSVTATASSTTLDQVSGNNAATGSVTYDGTLPSTPTNLAATRASATQVNLSWTASTDTGSGIAGYRIYRNGVLVTTTTGTGTTYSDTGLASHQPYWYWVVAVDAAGNASTASTGNGAVTYAEATSYRLQYVGNTALCAVAGSNANNGTLTTQSCTSSTAALRQWTFTTISGDDVYVRFQSGTARGWTTANNTSGTDILMSNNAGDTNARSGFNLGAYWTGTAAVIEIRKTNTATLCVDVTGNSTTAGAAVQQLTCNQAVGQRFALLQP